MSSIEELKKKFDAIASINAPPDFIAGQEELMKLAVEVGKSDLSQAEKDFFFEHLKKECLADDGRVSREEFEALIGKIEKGRKGK
ncbi:hypothetical protein COV61_00130 [Candidatus Micrarchaeota archaeon CG11_big_fil_rev_8_21_14_0_20_47_5]|nr:MAG: hypothetical protein COV61_00130 [Candidatus Micrarchaeota archaeon CG11_big_fil_rev_8_21_14_0_20_47_5]